MSSIYRFAASTTVRATFLKKQMREFFNGVNEEEATEYENLG